MKKILLYLLIISLIAYSESYGQRKMEKLGRGVVAFNKGNGEVYISWRLLVSDPDDIAFNIYRSIGESEPVKLNSEPITATTDYTDKSASTTELNTYYIKPVIKGIEQSTSGKYSLLGSKTAKSYISIPLQPLTNYSAIHVYVGDLDGDGEYDYIVKRFPSDPANNVYIEAYMRDGRFLWRIDLGPNMEQGASSHNPFILVHDFDCDGKADVLIRSGEGTVFADGYKIPDMNGDGITDYRTLPPTETGGYMLLGDNCPEYISMVDGLKGTEICRTDYIARGPKSQWVALWGDGYGHRMNMNHVGVAYLDGIHPSIIASRGPGEAMDIAAWDYINKELKIRWTWSSRNNKNIPAGYHWADFHNIRVADLDGDGKDEISWGVNAMDDNGTPLYYAPYDLGHGDRFVIADIDPERPGLECYAIQQASSVLAVYYNAKNGERIKVWSTSEPYDVGRGDVADIDPRYKGLEMWSYAHNAVLNCNGDKIVNTMPHPALSVWWDGDLLRENLDASNINDPLWISIPRIDKWNYISSYSSTIFEFPDASGLKSTITNWAGRVQLYADIFGDWREEVVCENSTHTEIRIFSTTIPASRRIYCLMQNPEYRLCINLKAYLPSTEVDYYLGEGMTDPPLPPVLDIKRRWKGGKSQNIWDETSANWISNDIESNYFNGDTVMFDILGSENTNILINNNLTPGNIYVITPVDYTFSGNGSISGNTNLVKSGQGSLLVQIPLNYNGITKIDEGAVYFNNTISNTKVTVNQNAIIGGNANISESVILKEGAIIMPGNKNEVGTINFSKSLILPGKNTVIFDITSDSTSQIKPSDKIIVSGDLSFNGSNIFKFNKIDGIVKAGLYPLISYSGSFSGDLNKITISGLFGQKFSLLDSSKTIWLKIFAKRNPATIVWAGTGKDWDLQTSPNWLYNNVSEIFVSGDSVIFNFTGNGQNSVNLIGELPVSNMIVETTNNDYSFSGTGNISGIGGIKKDGKNKLSLLNKNNTYTGKNIINQGTLEISYLDDAGLPSSIGASSSVSPSEIVFNNAKLKYIGNYDAYTNRGMTFNGVYDTIEVVNAGKMLTLKGVITGNARLVKSGQGLLSFLGQVNTYSGGTVIKQGTLKLNDDVANVSGLGSGNIYFEGGTLSMNNNRSTYTTCNWNMIVEKGFSGTLITDERCELRGTLQGSGTLNLVVTYIRTDLMGNWSNFSGTINVTTDSDGGDFRIYNSYGFPNAAINLGNNVVAYHASTGAQTISIGELSGTASSSLINEDWIIGNKNTDAVFNGLISGNSLTKVGTGQLVLTNANTYIGGTAVNAGKLIVKNTTGSGTGTGNVTVNNGGILGGTGIISGTVTLNAGSGIEAGENGQGFLTINNNVIMSGTSKAIFSINKSSNTNSKLVVNGTLSLNGFIEIVKTSGNYASGDSFVLFTATKISGSFTKIYPEFPAPYLSWDLSKLNQGILKIKDALTIDIIASKDTIICYTDTLKLDAGEGFSSYFWSNGSTSQKIELTVNTLGYSLTPFAVQVLKDNLYYQDVINIKFYKPAFKDLIPYTYICTNSEKIFDGGVGFSKYYWTGAAECDTRNCSVSGSSGKPELYLEVTDAKGCVVKDTVKIYYLEAPNPVITFEDGKLLTTENIEYTYQWYYESNIIENTNEYFITPSQFGNYNVEINSKNGCKAISETYYYSDVNINDNSNIYDILVNIYPNPNKGIFNISVSNNLINDYLKLTVTDITGKIIFNTFITKPNTIVELSDIPKGLYLIRLENNFQIINKKMIVL
jgi:autotransporter-associated beta strand protein